MISCVLQPSNPAEPDLSHLVAQEARAHDVRDLPLGRRVWIGTRGQTRAVTTTVGWSPFRATS